MRSHMELDIGDLRINDLHGATAIEFFIASGTSMAWHRDNATDIEMQTVAASWPRLSIIIGTGVARKSSLYQGGNIR